MPVYQAIGDALVTRDEYVGKVATGELDEFARALEANPGEALLEFPTGKATADNLIGTGTGTGGLEEPFARAGFVPIAMNKPLTIEIRHVYTGQFPTPSFFQTRKDMLVTSAMKSLSTFNVAPRAVNYLTRQVGARSGITVPAATDQGTPLIFYAPALIEPSNILTLEIAFDTFPDEVVSGVSSMFNKASGIPLFAPQSPYLLAAGTLTNILSQLGRRLFEGYPVFSSTVELSFDRPGSVIPQADYLLITDRSWDNAARSQYRVNEDGRLIDMQGGAPYSGPLPYIVISLDGRERKEYENFTPTAATAALLNRFYRVSEGQDQPLDPLLDAIRVYQDLQFRVKADDISRQMSRLDSASPEYQDLRNTYDGFVANILNDVLKPKQ